ncbi:NAD(P)H-dependent oxidoreductase [Staphylococcus simulans]|uniref:NAD(P)H-dependent oxidoreductase n=1 Tax=Staphylococcus simulans TaxID=1286 RepID=UPI000D1EE372|nr:NAD(P)H-dependent oxidoreductase [Staphylococcus simulans]MDY5061049.1 NAD(P)H-dependent oxidoreductase [Staphylococcus simulans]PTJ15139.1 NAD(P)H-dependent oxidoreductase [Staphylococcus simulans]
MEQQAIRNQILQAFNFRHATKRFNPDKKVSAEDFHTIIESGRLSPSSIGAEPWRFLVVQNEDLRQKLKKVSWGAQGQLDTASHFVILLARKNVRPGTKYLTHIMKEIKNVPDDVLEDMNKRYEMFQNDSLNLYESERSLWDWASKQTYIALGNMMSVAALLGVDSCPIEGFGMKEVTQLLSDEGIINEDEFLPSVMVAFGYREEDPKRAKTRQAYEDVIEWIE